MPVGVWLSTDSTDSSTLGVGIGTEVAGLARDFSFAVSAWILSSTMSGKYGTRPVFLKADLIVVGVKVYSQTA